MTIANFDRLSEAVRAGRHAILRGRLRAEIPLPRGAVGLRARCDGDARPLGTLRDAAVKSLRLLGDRATADALERRATMSIRRIGRDAPEAVVGTVLAALNALASNARGPATLILDEVLEADPATLDVLTRVARRPGVLRLSLVLALGGEPTTPAAHALLAAVLDGGGVDITQRDVERASIPAAPAERPSFSSLPGEVLLTLRAAATAGPSFDVTEVATLRDLPLLRVLEHLQIAKESGVPLDDSGEGRVRLPAELGEQLRGGVIASLARRWHRELARLHAAPSPPASDAPSEPDPAVRAEAPRSRAALKLVRPPEVPELRAEAVFEPAESPSRPEAPQRRSVTVPLPTSVSSSQDGVRAAAHLAAVGDLEGAARQLQTAVKSCADLGFPSLALEHARKALSLLDGLPDSDARRKLRAELLLMQGTLQCRASGAGDDFTLPAALQTLIAAREALPAAGASSLRARIACAIADACVELGELSALSDALDELTEATRTLRAEGASVEAARLLNDQAAVYLRLGDPVKAAWFLRQSREVFAARAEALSSDDPSRPEVLHELAETDHLFGKLTLRARARPGREGDALDLGREHLEAARTLFEELGATRDVARTLETLGRLEIRADHPRRAEAHLNASRAAAEAAGDVIGLARVTTALAELDLHEGRVAEALTRLSDALALNVEKGAAQGVALVRGAFEALAATPAGDDATLRSRIAAFGEELSAAESIVGRIELP